MQRFGQLLLKLRQERNLTIRALASEFEVTNSYITKLEKGTRLPSANLFLRISNYFGLHPSNLLEKCNNIPKDLAKEIKLKAFGETEYELRMRAAWETEDPKLKKLYLPFNDLLKYVQRKAKRRYSELKKYKNINRPKVIRSPHSKRKRNSQQSNSGGEAESDDGEPPIDFNFKIYKLKAKV